MQLTEHFSYEELVASEVAARKCIDNSPPVALDPNLQALAEALEEVRVVLGNNPMFITSGYRCFTLNNLIGGANGSAHCRAQAADFICPAFGPPYMICKAIAESALEYDQVIWEFGSWCHYGLALVHPRKQVLTIDGRGVRMGLERQGFGQ